MLQAEVESVGLSRVYLGQDKNFSGSLLPGKRSARDFQRLVAGAIINHDHTHVWISRRQRGPDGPFNDLLFVIGGDEHGNHRLIGLGQSRSSVLAWPQAVVDGKGSDKNQPPRHQNVAYEKYPGNDIEGQWK